MYRISMAILNHGMYRHILIVYHNAIAALVLSPFAHLLERSKSGLSHKHWLAGTALILVGCIAWSCFYVLQGMVSSGIAYHVQGLVLKERGPVFVNVFNPLCMIMVAVLGSAILGEQLHLGSKDYPVPPQSPDAQEIPITTAGATNGNQQSTQ
ncbi:hypothetical protein SLEP1_g45672 [Rubroshorea leprosula]|uniref:WAT1-related protein n=1 Tax=Rubroshorea leprosula TaxID=152421 RepID=A0AAV5LJR3_9ROSI|nr:hypothetical protein SLEP1_g45672 [Rubroshorea leprosula]